MKRKALLIGNSNGLSGVARDLNKMKNFLLSNIGGAWENDEITLLPRSTKEQLNTAILSIKYGSVDFCIVYFSGHGGHKRETILQLADNSEISENSLVGLSSRQITIFDCCRSVSPEITEDRLSASFESFSENYRELYRNIYNIRILQSIPQQIRLYSCSIGEYSNDTSTGGVYTNALMEAVKRFSIVGQIHNAACNIIENNWNYGKTKDEQQHPDAVLPKCLIDKQLILSLADQLNKSNW